MKHNHKRSKHASPPEAKITATGPDGDTVPFGKRPITREVAEGKKTLFQLICQCVRSQAIPRNQVHYCVPCASREVSLYFRGKALSPDVDLSHLIVNGSIELTYALI